MVRVMPQGEASMLPSARFVLIVACLCACLPAHAADKNAYSLFNPTPSAQMRDLSTDRPDKTESPYTVDAGHFQIETDLITTTRDHDKSGGGNSVKRGYSVGVTNFKAGLTHNTDVQMVVESYLYERSTDRAAGTRTDSSAFGDITLRLKHNIWGNDEGDTAFAVMPFVKLPTNSDNIGNDHVEGGVIVPYSFALTDRIGMAVMTQVNLKRDTNNRGYHSEFVNSVTAGTALTEQLNGYAEFYTSRATEGGRHWENTVDLGLTYGVNANLQLDTGINIGVTNAADDYNPFMGVAYRF